MCIHTGIEVDSGTGISLRSSAPMGPLATLVTTKAGLGVLGIPKDPHIQYVQGNQGLWHR